jgi:hypothetical protein
MYTVILLITIVLSDQELNTLKHLKLKGVSIKETIVNYQAKIKSLNDSILKATQNSAEFEAQKSKMLPTMLKNGCSANPKANCNHIKKGLNCLRISYQRACIGVETSNKYLTKLRTQLQDYSNKIKVKQDEYNKIIIKYKEILAKQ